MKIDGRKMRWFDCDWNNDTVVQNGCGQCRVCRYLDFLDYAHSVAPSGSTIQYQRSIDKYVELKTSEERQKFYFTNSKALSLYI